MTKIDALCMQRKVAKMCISPQNLKKKKNFISAKSIRLMSRFVSWSNMPDKFEL